MGNYHRSDHHAHRFHRNRLRNSNLLRARPISISNLNLRFVCRAWRSWRPLDFSSRRWLGGSGGRPVGGCVCVSMRLCLCGCLCGRELVRASVRACVPGVRYFRVGHDLFRSIVSAVLKPAEKDKLWKYADISSCEHADLLALVCEVGGRWRNSACDFMAGRSGRRARRTW